VAGCWECGDEPSSSCATELVNMISLAHNYHIEKSDVQAYISTLL
jgi:hypothetical protein